MASSDLFDAYFRRADVDRDGRISGQEAVSFFQGANLNREVLAKIWQYCDQRQTGYLSRAEFYNALKLVTVAQTGRELTPTIVSRALNGPAASQIPPPQIQFPSGPVPIAPQAQPSGAPRPIQPMGPSVPVYQQYPVADIPPGPQPMVPTSLPKPTNPAAPVRPSSISADWPTNKSSSWPGPASNNNSNGQIPQGQVPMTPQDGLQGSLLAGANSSSAKTPSSTELDLFGGGIFTAVPVKPTTQAPNLAVPQMPQPILTSNMQPRVMQTAVQPDHASYSLVPTSFMPAATSKMLQPVATPAGQQDRGFGDTSPASDPTKTWPKITDAVVRRYTKIFFEVDTDKDGKISGNQARDLFLSWHLPREVLKQIWDLSDQDHDSMLSVREFCVALYLMERHREGRMLPVAIPASFNFDESGVQALRISEAQVAVAQNSAGYNLPAWQQNPSVLQATGSGLPTRPVSQGVGVPGQSRVRSPILAVGREGFVPAQMVRPRSKAPVNQQARNDQFAVQNKQQETLHTEKKELEKQVMDSKEKMEFHRTKMQDIVLFKTRCDNRLAEISDKAAADKREVEALAKRYDEKYKQAAESQARLLADEAIFRDIQERKLELHDALVRMEQGGDLNAFLQVRADRLQNDLDELKKALNTKCKQIGLPEKHISLLEIPFGWQPGIQESAAEWDETWDKFENEGFAYIQDFMEEGTAGSDASKPKSVTSWDESERLEDVHDLSTTDKELHAKETVCNGNQNIKDQQDNTTAGNKDYDNVSSSGPGRSESPISSPKSTTEDSPKLDHKPLSPKTQFDEFASNGGEWASIFSHKKDETESDSFWGETESDSFWGRSDALSTKASATSVSQHDPFETLSISEHKKDDLPSFGPIQTKGKSSIFFDNSVPSTPLNSGYSPGPISRGGFFDDSVPSTPSYNNNAMGSGLNREQFARFDSFSSTSSDFPHSYNHTRFDSFSSTNSFARFDSFNHSGNGPSQGFTSFDEPELSSFGGNQSSKGSTDAWSAFG